MQGVTFFTDEATGHRILRVDFDMLPNNEETLEDLYDSISVEARGKEEFISWEVAKQQLNEVAQSLDNVFIQYWSKLSIAEKYQLLNLAKNYVELNETDPELARKKRIMQYRENYLNGIGKSYSWEEVKEMVLDKEKRKKLFE